jgi:hypothetical protein
MLNKKKWALMVTTAIISATSSGFGMENDFGLFKNKVEANRKSDPSMSLMKAVEHVYTSDIVNRIKVGDNLV